MTTQSSHASPILVTGAAGAVGSIGRNVTEMLLAKGHKVRALVRREDKRAEALRQLGAEVIQGDLTDLTAMHRAIEGCARVYFGMSVSADYLTATVNTAAVARHHGVEAQRSRRVTIASDVGTKARRRARRRERGYLQELTASRLCVSCQITWGGSILPRVSGRGPTLICRNVSSYGSCSG